MWVCKQYKLKILYLIYSLRKLQVVVTNVFYEVHVEVMTIAKILSIIYTVYPLHNYHT